MVKAKFRSAITDGLNCGAFKRVILAGSLVGLGRVGVQVVGHDDRLKGG
jgi:hypothetical protein